MLRTSARQHLTIDERIEDIGWDVVERRPDLGPCHEWRGGKHESGYALLHVRPRMVKVHRHILERSLGRELGEEFALHRCDNPPCIRAEHLYPGDASRNLRDALDRGRFQPSTFARGPRKVTPAVEAAIRADLAAGMTRNAVAKAHGLSWPTIDTIARRAENPA